MANNPYVNKVQKADGTSIIDITDTTAVASDVASGKYFYLATGQKVAGTGTGGSGDGYVWQDENGYVHLSDEQGTQPIIDSLTVNASGTYTAQSGHVYNPVVVPSGTAGTPSASKGTVSNHSVTVTPSVTNNTGWITGSTKTGTGVTVTASELANGNKEITQNGTNIDVVGYSTVSVDVQGGGGGGDNGNITHPIRFFDYDGTLVASYSAVPASLPSVPTHTGLTNGTWNYTLQQLSTQFAVSGACDVGANYITTSGDTEIDVEFFDSARLSPYLSFAVNGSASIDWGDDSSDTATGWSLTERTSKQHVYSAVGKYTIKITVVSGSSASLYCANKYPLLCAENSSSVSYNQVYADCVKAVRIGNNMQLGYYGIANCQSLKAISIPSSISGFGNYFAYNCTSLNYMTVPSGAELGTYMFAQCYNMRAVSLPNNITAIERNSFYGSTIGRIIIPADTTKIDTYAFYMMYALASIIIPSTVTQIGASAFQSCAGVKEFHIKATNPPTLGASAFSSIAPDCIIYVPSANLSDYQTAWSTYTSYIQGE